MTIKLPTRISVKLIIELVCLAGILIWLLIIGVAHAQQQKPQQPEDFSQGQRTELHHDLSKLTYQMSTVLGPDGTGQTNGLIKQLNDHAQNTDAIAQGQRDFLNKLWGAILGLGSLQGYSIVVSYLTGKKDKS